jgi:hypothetical protein
MTDITYKEETEPSSSYAGAEVAKGGYGERADDYPVGKSMKPAGMSALSMSLPGRGEVTLSRTGRYHSRSTKPFADAMSSMIPGAKAGNANVLPYGGENDDGSN